MGRVILNCTRMGGSETLKENLENRNFNKCKGYFLDGKICVAFDNTNCNCWVEEFETEEMAICWLENFYEISEIKEFEVLKIQKDLFFVPAKGFLKIQFQINSIISKFHRLFA